MSGNINPGRVVAVEFGPYRGDAGVQDNIGGEIDVAFFADWKAMRKVDRGTVGKDEVEVLSRDAPGKGRAGRVPGMIVLTVRKIEEKAG